LRTQLINPEKLCIKNKKQIKIEEDLKMMLNSLKVKIAAGVVAASMIGGTVFAATDAGNQLGTWYTSRFNTETGSVTTQLGTYRDAQIGIGTATFNTELGNNKKSITDTETTVKGTVNGAITAQVNEHIAAIEQKTGEIVMGMAGQFDTYILERNGETTGIVSTLEGQGRTQANTEINAQGTASWDSVKSELNTAKSDAAAALRKSISDAQTVIDSNLLIEQTSAITEVKGHVNSVITASLGRLTKEMSELATKYTVNIESDGNDIQNASIAELAKIVAEEINK
jgi:hypothetical protein